MIFDTTAEETVAGCAAFSRTAALACTDRLVAEHFHDPRCWAVVAASLEVPDVRPDVSADPWWREHRVADTANVHRPVLEEWCRQAPAAWDATGRFADRVLAAYQARQQAAAFMGELERLGLGVEVTA